MPKDTTKVVLRGYLTKVAYVSTSNVYSFGSCERALLRCL
ncbi:hypothetical protein Patl1_37023 [Pistacia atlantica]|nr:hypothetical protein Patl1_37023 [Pistacia atlantica]